MTHVLGICNLNASLFYNATHFDWPPLSAEKISLYLSHLVPEIIRPKVDLFFTKMYYLRDCKHFVSIFNPIDLFFLNFRSFWPFILQNLRSNWVQYFFRMLNPATENFVKYRPSPLPQKCANFATVQWMFIL